MKKIIITILAVMAVFTGCKKERIHEADGTGTLSLALKGGVSDYGDIVFGKASETPAVDVSKFSVKLEGLNGAYSKEWATYAEMPSVIELSSGEYTITATSPKTTDSVWGEPVYSGEEKFAIVVGGTSTVEVECGISNVKVTLSTNETFSKEIPEYEITVTDEEGKSLTWTQDDDLSQSGYFSASTLDVRVKGYRWDNVNNDGEPSIATFSQKIENVSPAHHYILNLSAKTTGKGTFNITIDDTLVDEEENIDIPGFDEVPVDGGEDPDPDDPGEPETQPITMEWPANPDFSPITIGEAAVDLKINVPSGISTFVVNVSDNFKDAVSLITTGNVDYLDLINDSSLIENLSGIDPTMPLGDNLKGKTSVDFSLTSLVNLITQVGEPGAEYEFTLSISDSTGSNFTKTVTFINPAA